jgi:ABC-type transporter Mla MlaB component
MRRHFPIGRPLALHVSLEDLKMMRISVVQSSSQTVVLSLEGEVKGGWVAELNQSCEKVLSQGIVLTLDLAGVSFIDRDGIALFHKLQDRAVAIRNASYFVAELLGASSDDGCSNK